MIKRLSKCIREYKTLSILTPVLMIGEVLMESLIPFIVAMLVNDIKNGCSFETIVRRGLLLFVMACVSLAFGGVAGGTAAKASAGFSKNLRHDIYEKIQGFSFDNIDKFSSSSLVTRITTDVTFVQMAYMIIIRIAIRSPMMFLFSTIMAFIMGGKLALLFVVVIPIMVFGLVMIAKKAMPRFEKVFHKYDKLNESIEENVRGIRVVKSFTRESYEKEKFSHAADEIRKDFTRAERIVVLNSPLMQFCLYIDMVAVLLFGSQIIISSQGLDLNVGQFSSMLTYGFQILISLMGLSMVYVMLTISKKSAERIVEVLNEESTIKAPDDPVMDVKDGSIDFEKVNFQYAKTAHLKTLSDVDLHIASGQTVGILGGTGASKSTLVQLIPRLYDVTEGTVRVGGVDVRRYDLTVLRDQVAMVLQKNELFSGTIAQNLRWGNENATDEELYAACRLAQADDFIRAFPKGYDTWIEQGGVNVSGGQKQRLCIARALLKKPKILILDDSTSAVDTHTDALIRQGFKDYIPETTKIIIAQRVASVQDADMILIMDGGKITASGTHDTLLATNAIYRELYESQTKGEDHDAQ